MVAATTSREHIIKRVASFLTPSVKWNNMINLHILIPKFAPAVGAMSMSLVIDFQSFILF